MSAVPKMAYTMAEAAQATGFTRNRLYQFIGEGRLATFTSGRRRMVSARALQEFIANLERESAKGAA